MVNGGGSERSRGKEQVAVAVPTNDPFGCIGAHGPVNPLWGPPLDVGERC